MIKEQIADEILESSKIVLVDKIINSLKNNPNNWTIQTINSSDCLVNDKTKAAILRISSGLFTWFLGTCNHIGLVRKITPASGWPSYYIRETSVKAPKEDIPRLRDAVSKWKKWNDARWKELKHKEQIRKKIEKAEKLNTLCNSLEQENQK